MFSWWELGRMLVLRAYWGISIENETCRVQGAILKGAIYRCEFESFLQHSPAPCGGTGKCCKKRCDAVSDGYPPDADVSVPVYLTVLTVSFPPLSSVSTLIVAPLNALPTSMPCRL